VIVKRGTDCPCAVTHVCAGDTEEAYAIVKRGKSGGVTPREKLGEYALFSTRVTVHLIEAPNFYFMNYREFDRPRRGRTVVDVASLCGLVKALSSDLRHSPLSYYYIVWRIA